MRFWPTPAFFTRSYPSSTASAPPLPPASTPSSSTTRRRARTPPRWTPRWRRPAFRSAASTSAWARPPAALPSPGRRGAGARGRRRGRRRRRGDGRQRHPRPLRQGRRGVGAGLPRRQPALRAGALRADDPDRADLPRGDPRLLPQQPRAGDGHPRPRSAHPRLKVLFDCYHVETEHGGCLGRPLPRRGGRRWPCPDCLRPRPQRAHRRHPRLRRSPPAHAARRLCRRLRLRASPAASRRTPRWRCCAAGWPRRGSAARSARIGQSGRDLAEAAIDEMRGGCRARSRARRSCGRCGEMRLGHLLDVAAGPALVAV